MTSALMAVGMLCASMTAGPTAAAVTRTSSGVCSGTGGSSIAPYNSVAALIRQTFRHLEQREPTPAESATWTAQFAAGHATQQSLISDLWGLTPPSHSTDHSRHAIVIARLYHAYFGNIRVPDEAGFSTWLYRYRTSFTLDAISQAFAKSPEFVQDYGALSNGGFVDQAYVNVLGETPGHIDSGAAYWINLLDTHKLSRGQVMLAIAGSPSYKAQMQDRVFAELLFLELMGIPQPKPGTGTYVVGRAPTAAEVTTVMNCLSSGQAVAAAAGSLTGSPEFATYVVPGPPTGVTGTAGADRVTVSWTAPTYTAGSPVTGYTVTAAPGGQTCTTNARSCTVTGLGSHVPYTFTVTASTAIGTSSPSTASAPIAPLGWQVLTSPQVQIPWTPAGINDAGTLVGDTGEGRGVVCTGSCASPTVLPAPASEVVVSGVSTAGVIVGYGADPNHAMAPVGLVWAGANASPTLLSTTGSAGTISIQAVGGVSPAGVIFGYGHDQAGAAHGLLWTSATAAPTVLPKLAGDVQEQVSAVAASGIVVGYGQDGGGISHGLVWASASSTPTILTAPSGYSQEVAVGITSTGTIVGWAQDGTGTDQGLLWSGPGAMATVLSSPFGNAVVAAVSPSGVIIGNAFDDAGFHGLEWTSTGTPTTFGATGYTQVAAAAISPSGVVVGSADDGGHNPHLLKWAAAAAVPTLITAASGPANVTVAALTAAGMPVGTGFVESDGGPGTSEGLSWAPPQQPPSVLAVPTGYSDVTVVGVSQSGEAVGYGRDATSTGHSLVWSSLAAAPVVLAEPAGYTDVLASGVSWQDGTIFGTGVDSGTDATHGLVWSSPGTPPTVLPTPDGFDGIAVAGVLPGGAVVGSGFDHSNLASGEQALLWTSLSDDPTVLPTPGGFSNAIATGVSSTGVIFGDTSDGAGVQYGAVWSSTSSPPAVLAAPAGYTDVIVSGISAAGTIVGRGTDSSGKQHPLLWPSSSSAATVLAPPAGYTDFTASGISPLGVVFGSATGTDGVLVGFTNDA